MKIIKVDLLFHQKNEVCEICSILGSFPPTSFSFSAILSDSSVMSCSLTDFFS